jgi:hypothetical protein
MDPYQAIEYAVELLLKAGYVFKYQSMKTEARYYCLLGHEYNVIRVAAHKHDRGMPGMGRVVCRITFSAAATPSYGFSHQHVENIVATAIGMYCLRISGAVAYKGRQPRRTATTRTPVPEPALVSGE